MTARQIDELVTGWQIADRLSSRRLLVLLGTAIKVIKNGEDVYEGQFVFNSADMAITAARCFIGKLTERERSCWTDPQLRNRAADYRNGKGALFSSDLAIGAPDELLSVLASAFRSGGVEDSGLVLTAMSDDDRFAVKQDVERLLTVNNDQRSTIEEYKRDVRRFFLYSLALELSTCELVAVV